MTRIFSDGAEFDDLLFWTSTSSMTLAGSARSGNYCYALTGSGNASKSFTAISELYMRFGYYASANSSDTSNRIMAFRYSTTTLCYLNLDALFHLNAYVGSGSVEDSGVILDPAVWHVIEVHLKIADSPNGIFQVKLDGVQIINFSGDTKPGSDTTIDNIQVVRAGAALYWDDLAMNDTAGGADDSWCGDGHIELLNPMTGGTYQWTGSDGDSVDNYALVDEIPPTADTDYVKDSTAGHRDIYTLTDFTGTGKIVTRIWAEVRAKDNDATSGQIKLGFKTGGGTVYLSTAARTLSGNYARVVGDDATVNPDDAGAWEDADIDALQCVIECE